MWAGGPDLRFGLVVFCHQPLQFAGYGIGLPGSVRFGQQCNLIFRAGTQPLLQYSFTLQKLGVGTLMNIDVSFSQHVQQAAGSGPFARLERRGIQMHLHQQVDVKLVFLLHGGKIAGTRLRSRDLAAC